MTKLKNTIISFLAVLLLVGSTPVMATVSTTSSAFPVGLHGDWQISELISDSNIGNIESYKVDRDLVAWTIRNDYTGTRYLQTWNGFELKTLAIMNLSDWSSQNEFYDSVTGEYDVADGVVVWSMNVENDREIFYYRDGEIRRLTTNDSADVHPVVSEGRIAWTAYTDSGAYHLMVADLKYGIKAIAQYHVLNYKFSGNVLYWLNKLPNEDWFRVYSNNGYLTRPIGKGDDRAIKDYFIADDLGSVAWEYSTKRWDYDKREVFASVNGEIAYRVLQRDVPPNVTKVEDVFRGEVLVNSQDLLTSKVDDTSLYRASLNSPVTVTLANVMTKALFTGEGVVRHQTANTSSPLTIRYDRDGLEDMISIERVEHEVFDAHSGVVVAGLRDRGGVIIHENRKPVVIWGGEKIRDIKTQNGTIAWLAGNQGSTKLMVAVKTILVGNATETKSVTGRLVKSDVSDSVYLASTNGTRYVFPGENQFYSWYNDFGSLENISAEKLSAMPLAGTVLYPSGTLLKTPSAPQVYMIGKEGKLHWVIEGLVLSMLYGNDWNKKVYDIPSSFMASYMYGAPIAGTNGYYSMTAFGR